MNKDEVELGGVYLAKVGKHTIEVQIKGDKPKGGWNAVATATNKPMTIKDAEDLQPAGVAPASDAEATTTGTADVGGANVGSDADAPVPARNRPAKKAPKPKAAKVAKEKLPAGPKPMSCLDAAAAVLKAKGEPMQCKAMIDAMREQGLWTSSAPTPHATLFSALLREIKTKGSVSRFTKADRGHFALNEKGD